MPRKPVDVLREARQRESREKRQRVRAMVDTMVTRGERITFTAVRERAGVSLWLVYQEPLASYIREAKQRSHNGDWVDSWDNDNPYSEVILTDDE